MFLRSPSPSLIVMKHLCKSCSELDIDDLTIASIKSRLSHDCTIHVLRDVHCVGIDVLQASANGILNRKACHLCALILRSLKDPRQIGTSEEDATLPSGPLALEIHVDTHQLRLVAKAGDDRGHPLQLSFDSGQFANHTS